MFCSLSSAFYNYFLILLFPQSYKEVREDTEAQLALDHVISKQQR